MQPANIPGMRVAGQAQSATPPVRPAGLEGVATSETRKLDARLALIAALAQETDAESSERMADALLSCLSVGAVDLTQLPDEWQARLGQVPTAAWGALDRHASVDGPEIMAVSLPVPRSLSDNAEAIPSLCVALGGMPGLSHLAIHLPDVQPVNLDLGRLTPGAPKAIVIQLPEYSSPKGTSPFRAEVTVPDGVEVHARGVRMPSIHKSFVTWVDTKGESVGEKRALAEAAFFRQPHDFLVDQEVSLANVARASAYLNLNGRADFPPATDREGGAIVCKHLMMHWLLEQASFLQSKSGAQGDSKAAAPGVRLSMRALMSIEGIRGSVHEDLIESSLKSLKAQENWAPAHFEMDGLGDMIASRLGAMQPGETQLFGIRTHTHALGLRLQVKPAMHGTHPTNEFVATLYDPNSTATHVRAVTGNPASFGGQALSAWTGEGLAERYCGSQHGPLGRNTLCHLHQWPPADKAVAMSRAVAAAGPQHALVGKRVEINTDDEALLRGFWDENLRALPGGGPDKLICVTRSNGRSVHGLEDFRVSGSAPPREVPGILMQAAFSEGGVYLIPAELLRMSNRKRQALAGKAGLPD